MAKYRCTVCNYVYDEKKEGVKFSSLPSSWRCPVCGASKKDNLSYILEKGIITS